MADENQVDFSLLLASSVHDIKNSLGMLLTSLDEVINISAEENPAQRKNYCILRGEASRINQTLIYLLGLYRLQLDQLTIHLNEVCVKDFLEEQIASQQLLFDINNINITLNCEDTLMGFFDESLIAGVVSNILVNCAKYTKDKILLAAKRKDKGFELTIIDNGGGYPESIIDQLDNDNRGIDFSTGSTNLGLFFAQKIANIHQCHQQKGSVMLSNLNQGGGCFTLTLP